jgi:hypothetical protein
MFPLTFLLVPLVSAAALLPRDDRNRAAYFLDNNPAGTSIVALEISVEDGTLSNPVRTPAGGVGLYGLTASSTGGAPAAGDADTLFTQDSVVVSQDVCTSIRFSTQKLISLVSVHRQPREQHSLILPHRPKQSFTSDAHRKSCPLSWRIPSYCRILAAAQDWYVGILAPVLRSLTVSACVLNGGAVAGITCYSVDHQKGLAPLEGLRSLALNQTTPPVGPPGTVSDLAFNPSQTALIATVKGNGVTPGYIFSYPVNWDGSIATEPIISRPSELFVDFSISFIGSDSRAIITDPAYGASIVNISPDLEFSVETKIPIPGEGAVCWSVYSERFNTIYVFDGANPNVTLIDPSSGAIKGVIAETPSAGGSLDSQIDRQFLYTLKGNPYIAVADNTGLTHGKLPTQVQLFDLSSLGPRTGFEGLAIYPSS